MNTTAAATQAGVTVATIRTWCRAGVIAAAKRAGRWIIDTASLAHRIEIGARRMDKPDPAAGLSQVTLTKIRRARLGYTPRRADKAALADRYVVAYPFADYKYPSFPGVDVWRQKGLLDDVTVNGRTYYALSEKAVSIRESL